MSRMTRSAHFPVLLFVAAYLTPVGVTAQSIWVDPGLDNAVTLEALKPNLDADVTTFTTSVHFLGLRFPASDRLRVVAEVPFAYGDVEDESGGLPDGVDQSTLGNPYVGVEWTPSEGSPFFLEFGVRAPITSDLLLDDSFEEGNFGTAIGLLTEFGNRSEAFVPDVLPVNSYANYTLKVSDSPVALRLRGGPSLWIPTAGGSAELLAAYSAQLWYVADRFSLGGGYIGRAIVTAEDTSFGDATFNQVGASANLTIGRFVPGAQFRVPLDKDDGVDFIAGFNLGFRLN